MDSKEKSKLVRFNTAEGYVIMERDVLNLAEKIQAYDHNLVLKYCEAPAVGDAPYKLFERCPDGVERKVMDIWEFDERILERLYAADNARNNVLQSVDGHNLSVESLNQRRYKEEMAEAADMLQHLLKSPKGRYSMRDPKTGVKLTLDDQEGIPAKVERPL